MRFRGQKCLLSTPLFTVEHREYDQGGGQSISRDVVVHPGAVVMLPLLDDRTIVMIRNYRYTVEEELWELPAGTLEPNESPLSTARRELQEETGYRAEEMTPFAQFYTSPGVSTELMYAFVATGLVSVGQNLQSGERIEVERVGIADARDRMREGAFRDAKTIAVLGMFLAGPRTKGT